jgi:predicted dehydrogenase
VATKSSAEKMSADIDSHTQTESLRVHYSDTDDTGQFLKDDEVIDLTDEPDHNELCKREQLFFLKSIREDMDLTSHWNDAVNSMRIVLAADESIRTGHTVMLGPMDGML